MVEEIHTKKRELMSISRGIAAQKAKSRRAMEAMALTLAAKAHAYHAVTPEYLIHTVFKITATSLKRRLECEIVDFCSSIESVCTSMATELAPYGLTTELLTKYIALIDDFKDKMINMPQNKATVSTNKEMLHKLVLKAETLVKKVLDPLAALLEETNAAQYERYKDARKVVKVKYHKVALRVSIVRAEDGKPERRVQFVLTLLSYPDGSTPAPGKAPTYMHRTSDRGKGMIKTMVPGKYSCKTAKVGYKPNESEVTIVKNERTMVQIRLEKS